jgi:proteasome lid subunit RPN8/RPN11
MRRSKPVGDQQITQDSLPPAEEGELTYHAIITLTLPDMDDTVAAHVILTPADQVDSGDRTRPLRDCTLADLTAFAERLEQDVWETYQSVKLIELADAEDAQLEVTVEDKKGRAIVLQNWQKQAVLVPSTEPKSAIQRNESDKDQVAQAETERSAQTEAIPAEGVTETTGPAEPSPPESEAAITPVESEPPEEIPWVTVSESEPVFAEREAVDDPHAFPTPAIAPSQARVRIAGQRLPLAHATWAAVDILVDEPALRSAQAHALSSPDREVAGVLLGPQPEKQPDGRYVVHIIDTVIAKYTVMQGASVTYTSESWRYMNDKLAERYPDESAVMVGWYHTHPGFGIFLSGMDQFIHQNFFTQIWHIAMVLDPLARKSGFFVWDRMQTRVGRVELPWPNWAAASW